MRGVHCINLYHAALRWVILQVSDMYCKASLCLLIFYLPILSIIEKEELKFLSIIVDLSISP